MEELSCREQQRERTLQLQKQWLTAGMTSLQSHVRPEKLGLDELLAVPSSVRAGGY